MQCLQAPIGSTLQASRALFGAMALMSIRSITMEISRQENLLIYFSPSSLQNLTNGMSLMFFST